MVANPEACATMEVRPPTSFMLGSGTNHILGTPKIPLTEAEIRELHEKYLDGATLQWCGDQVDVTREGIRQAFLKRGLYVRNRKEAKENEARMRMAAITRNL